MCKMFRPNGRAKENLSSVESRILKIGNMEIESSQHADAKWTHAFPLEDLIEHVTDNTFCECNPRMDVANRMFIHNALDNREFDEIAEQIEKGSQ